MTARAWARVAGWLLVAWTVGAAAQEKGGGNRILAIVNDEIVTEGDVKAQMSALLKSGESLPGPGDHEADQMRQSVLAHLIDERVIVQEAKRLALTVGPEEIAARLRQIQQEVGSPEAFTEMLTEANLTEEQLKTKLREQALVQRAIDREIRSKIVISPLELAQAMGSGEAPRGAGEEVRAYHLVVRVTPQRSPEAALRRATEAHDKIAAGANFEEIARLYADSEDEASGVMLGWVSQGQLLPELDQALFQLKPGELSPPVQTRVGFHVVKLLERRTIPPQAAESQREQVRRTLYQQKFLSAFQEWLTKLKAKAYIQLINN